MTPEEKLLIENFIDLNLVAAYRISEGEGVFEVARSVRLVVGEGESKIEVGVAEVDKLPNGDAMVTVKITNSALIKALGGEGIKGIITKLTEAEEDETGA